MGDVEALLAAVRAGDAEAVAGLLDRTPGLVGRRGPAGETPILAACYHRRPAVLGLLRARGATLDLFEAAAAGDVRRLGELTGADPAAVGRHAPDGWTPLHLAAHFGHGPALDLLLARGADPRARSANALANTALHAALAGGVGVDLVERLLVAGAEVDAVAGGGYTPLHLAAGRGDLRLVARLLLRGGSPGARTAAGQTAADLARGQGHEPVAQLLERWWGEHARIVARREQRLSPWVTLLEKEVEFAPGRPPDTYHALGPAEYVVAVARTPEGLVPVVRQFRPAIEQYTWELPSGLVDPGETPEVACRRELLEETGLRAERVTYLGGLHPDAGRLDVRQHIYRVEASGPAPEFVPEPGVAVDYLAPAAVLAMVRSGAFTQLHHIAALFLAGLDAAPPA
jgi:ankyrin repeat protein/8-oxo-dGTP pyrophosphatase MutT (NUDIX family)